ncbi:alpha/beta fold hydrolase [Rhodococcus sp. UNC363MFTsu5.1]|uniref:alpha/beta fold hydrolase n=1 Tax=Rhodococcus sp. UNC363MFTsu5.1 TaxID=1449069 RepID=UPI000561B513|nr:alpha/beta hydrolase [Rhodococcus sp. UNC363MFTsu5.1]
MPFVETASGSVFYEDSGGDGPAVIVSHGFLMDHSMFDAQAEALSDYRLIRWDTRHHGQSKTAATAYSFWDQARDGLAILEHLGVDSAVFGGHSQGGFIALRMALLEPTACRGLLLLGTAAGAYTDLEREGYRRVFTQWTEGVGHEEFEPMVWALASSMIGGVRELHQAPWCDRWLARDWSTFSPAIGCLVEHDSVEELLGQIRCPALVVRGSADQAFSEDSVNEMIARLGGVTESRVIDQLSHGAAITHPELVNPILERWLSQLPVGPPKYA